MLFGYCIILLYCHEVVGHLDDYGGCLLATTNESAIRVES